MQLGFVALLDVLGFAALVSGDNADQRLQNYLGLLEGATKENEESFQVEYVVFSDSIVLTSRDASAESFLSLSRSCSRLFSLMLNNDIPLRGAISYGSYIRSPSAKGVFVAGRAIIDAYRFETTQDWVGIMLIPSIVKQIPEIASRCIINVPRTIEQLASFLELPPWHVFIQPCGGIPFHSTDPYSSNNFEGFAIIPTTGVSEPSAILESLKLAQVKLNWLKSLAPDPNAQQKYRHTINWLNNVSSHWENVVGWKRQLEGK